jgi:hypothetical protein
MCLAMTVRVWLPLETFNNLKRMKEEAELKNNEKLTFDEAVWRLVENDRTYNRS